jgi:F0F1-type ATP synthase membrane subunit b/b'
MDDLERVIGIVLLILGFLGTPIGFFLGRRRREAEADRTEAEAGRTKAEEGRTAAEAGRTKAEADRTAEEGGKASAEATGIIREVYGGIIGDLAERVDAMEENNATLRKRVNVLESILKERDARILQLEKTVEELRKKLGEE